MPLKIENYTTAKTARNIALQGPASTTAKPSLPWYQRDIQLFGTGMGAKEKKSFYTELAVLLNAGLDIQKTLVLIEESQAKKKHKEMVLGIRDLVVSGDSLSDALEKNSGFSAYETVSIRIGEESGRLSTVLEQLSHFFTKSVKYRQQLMGALSYPAFVTGFAFTVVFFLLRYLVPMFSDVYKRFDSELPAITQRIISLSDWTSRYGGLLIAAILGLIAVLFALRKRTVVRKWSAALVLRMPLFGEIVRHIFLARFCQSMSLLLGAKVSLMRAVELVRQMSPFYPLETSLARVEKDVLNGKSLHESLSAYTFYPPQLIALLRVGEETGNLEQMFANLADQYNDRVDARTALIGSLLEPVLIIGLGVLVGFILVAMYLPLFQMSTSIG